MAELEPFRSPFFLQLSSPHTTYQPTINSIQQKVRRLCNLLAADNTGSLCAANGLLAGDGQKKSSSVNRLQNLFWGQLLRKNDTEVTIQPTEEKIKQVFLELYTDAERVECAGRFLELAGNFPRGENLLEEEVLKFLIDLRASKSLTNRQCKIAVPNVMRKIFETSRISRSRRPQINGCNFDVFRPRDFEFKIFPETAEFFQQKLPIVPVKINSSTQKEAPLKLYVGDFLASFEISKFHAIFSHRFDASSNFGNVNRTVTAAEFLAELGRVAVGMNSALFDWEEDGREFRLKSDFLVLGYSSEARDDVASLICALGSCVQRIRCCTSVKMDSYDHHPGLTFTQFVASVKFYMEAWTKNVKDLWKNLKSFLDLGLRIRPLLLPIQLLDQICLTVTGVAGPDSDAPIRGLSLLQLLYEKCLGLLGMNNVIHLGLFLLEETVKPFFAFATSLAVLGNVHDPYGEFGITVDQDLLIGRFKDDFWEAVLNFTDSCPSFLSDFLLGAARAAKCLFLLRLICPYHPMLPSLNQENGAATMSLILNFNTDPELYRKSFERYRKEMQDKIEHVTSQALLEKTFGSTVLLENSTQESCRFTLFQNSASENTNSTIFPAIWRRYNECFKAIVQQELLSVIDIQVGLADTAVVQLFKDHLGLENLISVIKNYFFLENGEFAAVFVSSLFEKASVTSLKECLDFSTLLIIFDLSLLDQVNSGTENITRKLTLLSTHYSQVERTATSFDVSDYLGLQYKIDWPLSMIVTPDLIQKCNVIFRRLLRIRGCTWAMNDAFVMLSEGKGVANDANRCLLSVYRHEIAHFARVLEVHLMDVAIHRPWRELQMRLSIANCFEQIRDCVAVYFNGVYDLFIVAGSNSSKFLHRLNDIFRLVMRFYSQLQAEASFEDLQKTFHLFQHCVHCIWQYAEKRSVPLDFDAECFLARLDFSGYVQATSVSAVKRTNRSLLRSPYGTL